MSRVFLTAALAVALLYGCGEDPKAVYDKGYGDGYKAGYDKTCQLRTTTSGGNFLSAAYSKGYRQGFSDGTASCLTKGVKGQ